MNRALHRSARTAPRLRALATVLVLAPYVLAGTLFGFALMKSEVASWYRIQEMFRFHSFHMVGVIGSAVLTAALSLWLIRRFRVRTLDGDEIVTAPKARTWPRYILGGTLFGIGWGLTGACPGPMLALAGAGAPAFALALLAAIAGTYAYGTLRDRLPH